MQGFLWLLFQMALLLLAAAVVFFSLGWRWRGQKATAQALSLNASVDAEATAAERARLEKEASQSALVKQIAVANREAAELLEARERQRQLEREILRLAEELKSVRRQHEEPTPQPQASAPTEVSQPAPPPAVSTPQAGLPESAAKPSRHKKADPKTKAGAPDPRKVLAALEEKEHAQQILVGALNQEREGWEQRVESLSTKAVADPAGFALASKNLARSAVQHTEAIAGLKSLQRQVSALQRSLAASATPDEDDLTRIKGIKAALDQQLRAFGIRTYRQIALMSSDDLLAFSELLAFKNRAQRDEWQRQARDLHRAKYGGDAA